MRKLVVIAGFAVVVALSVNTQVPAQNLFQTGKELHDWSLAYQRTENNSARGRDYYSASTYLGYIVGAIDGYSYGLVQQGVPVPFYVPPQVTMTEICAVIGKYLDDHPQLWSYPAGVIILDAIVTSYPKRQSQPPNTR